jgi:mannonate dehydratase
VVDSVPIHEDIKTRTGNYRQYIDNYHQSLRNLTACGVKLVTNKFNPINDWTRPYIDYPITDGCTKLYFNRIDLAVFDIHLLQRPGAFGSHLDTVIAEAEKRFAAMIDASKKWEHTVLYGIHRETRNSAANMRQQLAVYEGYTRARPYR